MTKNKLIGRKKVGLNIYSPDDFDAFDVCPHASQANIQGFEGNAVPRGFKRALDLAAFVGQIGQVSQVAGYPFLNNAGALLHASSPCH